MSLQAEVSYLTLSEALQDIFIRQRTGVLTVTAKNRRERFFLFAGQLYLSGTNPCRDRVERLFAGPPEGKEYARFDPRVYLSIGLRRVVETLGETLASWTTGDLRFSEELGDVPEDIVGPVPTASLVMDLYTRGWTFQDLLQRLGGAGARYRAIADDRSRRRVVELDAAEFALLERLETAASVNTLMKEAEDATNVLSRLMRLTAVGLTEVASEPGARTATIPRDVLDGISERIREDLEEKPLELDAELHRARVDKLLDEYGRLGFFDLLGVSGDASTEEIHAAFTEAARLAHPMHAEVLGLAKSRRKLEWLSARLTEAYLVLSDPERSAEYQRGMGAAAPSRSVQPNEEARKMERAALARESYRAALNYVERADYFYAIELLNQAVRTDERPEYYLLLGRCEMQNRKWLHMAVDSFRRGLALQPDDEQLRLELMEAREIYRRYREELEEKQSPEAAQEKSDETRARRILSKLRREPR